MARRDKPYIEKIWQVSHCTYIQDSGRSLSDLCTGDLQSAYKVRFIIPSQPSGLAQSLLVFPIPFLLTRWLTHVIREVEGGHLSTGQDLIIVTWRFRSLVARARASWDSQLQRVLNSPSGNWEEWTHRELQPHNGDQRETGWLPECHDSARHSPTSRLLCQVFFKCYQTQCPRLNFLAHTFTCMSPQC